MKKKYSKILMSAVAMSLSLLVACSSTGTGSSDSQQGTKTTIKLGGIAPLSGNYAHYGVAAKNGAELAVSEINANGGVNGMKFVLDFQDSQGDPQVAVNAYGKLLDSGMDVSLGAILSAASAAVTPAAIQDGIFILNPTASSIEALGGNPNAFRVSFNDPAQGKLSAKYISENNLAKKVAVFYASDSDYSVGIVESFKKEAQERGLEIVSTQTFTESTKTDFSTQIDAIANTDAELVFLPIYAAEASVFLEQAQNKLKGKLFFGCDGLDGILSKISDPKKAENLMIVTQFAADAEDEKVKTFVDAYKAKYNAVPDQFSAGSYDAVYIVADLLKHAKITSEDYKDFSKRLVKAIQEIEFKGTTGTIRWQSNGEAVKDPRVVIIKDGAAVGHKK